MPRKFTDALINDAIKRLSEGKMLKTVAKELGVTPDNLSIYVRKRGIQIPRPKFTADRTCVPHDEIIALYQSGVSELEIARRFNCSRQVIRRHLARENVTRRTVSEANKLRYAQTTKEYRQALTRAAHDAVRGTQYSHEEMCRRALSREHSGFVSHFGPGETEICNALSERGISFIRQKAVDIYNVDIAVGHVAVEVTCNTSRYRGATAKVKKRIKKLLECGYSPVTIEFSNIAALPVYLDKVVSAIDEARGLPPFAGEYWMIRCYSQDRTVFRNQLGQFSAIRTPEEFFYERKTIQL